MNLRSRFFHHPGNVLGLLLVLLFICTAVFAPVISPEDPDYPGPIKIIGRPTDLRLYPPTAEAPLGTLPGQVSVYHSLIWGTRSALTFGVLVAVFTAFIGMVVGAVSAYAGGFINRFLMRITDAFLSFPIIAGVVLIHQIITSILYNARFGVLIMSAGDVLLNVLSMEEGAEALDEFPLLLRLLQQLDPILIAFILFSWMPYARIMNAMVMTIKKAEFVEASRALGAGPFRLIFNHLVPNAIAPILVLTARDVGGMVLLQATFCFIGMGNSSIWGVLLALGRDWIISPGGLLTYWWAFLPATMALVLFGVGWNLLGDGLNDALNPRNR